MLLTFRTRVSRDAEDGSSAAAARDATAEAVTEAVKRPQPDADSAAVEQPDADAVPADRRRRVNVRPGFADHARRVTREGFGAPPPK